MNFSLNLLKLSPRQTHTHTNTLTNKLYSSTKSVFPNSVCQGVTFLALGNGAPDVFSATVAFSRPHTAGLAIGALFGTYTYNSLL